METTTEMSDFLLLVNQECEGTVCQRKREWKSGDNGLKNKPKVVITIQII